jgi:hypothetical protein
MHRCRMLTAPCGACCGLDPETSRWCISRRFEPSGGVSSHLPGHGRDGLRAAVAGADWLGVIVIALTGAAGSTAPADAGTLQVSPATVQAGQETALVVSFTAPAFTLDVQATAPASAAPADFTAVEQFRDPEVTLDVTAPPVTVSCPEVVVALPGQAHGQPPAGCRSC